MANSNQSNNKNQFNHFIYEMIVQFGVIPGSLVQLDNENYEVVRINLKEKEFKLKPLGDKFLKTVSFEQFSKKTVLGISIGGIVGEKYSPAMKEFLKVVDKETKYKMLVTQSKFYESKKEEINKTIECFVFDGFVEFKTLDEFIQLCFDAESYVVQRMQHELIDYFALNFDGFWNQVTEKNMDDVLGMINRMIDWNYQSTYLINAQKIIWAKLCDTERVNLHNKTVKSFYDGGFYNQSITKLLLKWTLKTGKDLTK